MRATSLLGVLLAAGIAHSACAAPPTYDHIVVVMEENHSFSQVIGSGSAPFINSLVAGGSSLTNMIAITHPSQPNYLHFFSGASQGITDDNVPATYPFSSSTNNLGAALIAGGKTFAGYSESMPSVGYNGATFTTVAGQNQYVRKHNPWANWQSATPSGTLLPLTVNQPFTSFPTDYSALPNVSIVVPNEQDDMHDGTIAQADTWLSTNVGGYATWAKAHNSLLVVTFDEDNSAARNLIPTIFYGANVKVGTNASTWTTHNLLRTIEDSNGVTHSGAAANVKSIAGSFVASEWPQIKSFQQGSNGYTSAHDTYIDASATTTQHGTASIGVVDGSPNQQALVRFDDFIGNGPGQVAPGETILSAKLRFVTGSNTNDESTDDVGLYTMKRTWTDSDTWSSLGNGISTDGTEASASATFTVTPNKEDVYVVFDVTDTVQQWVDGTLANDGWLLKDLTGTNGWRWPTSEGAAVGDRPYLEITILPEPGRIALVAGLIPLLVARSRRAKVG